MRDGDSMLDVKVSFGLRRWVYLVAAAVVAMAVGMRMGLDATTLLAVVHYP